MEYSLEALGPRLRLFCFILYSWAAGRQVKVRVGVVLLLFPGRWEAADRPWARCCWWVRSTHRRVWGCRVSWTIVRLRSYFPSCKKPRACWAFQAVDDIWNPWLLRWQSAASLLWIWILTIWLLIQWAKEWALRAIYWRSPTVCPWCSAGGTGRLRKSRSWTIW